MNSLIIPIYKNEENIVSLLDCLKEWNGRIAFNLEVVFVIDGSPDKCGEILVSEQNKMPYCSQIIFHSRNFGSFTAIRTGIEKAKGNNIAVMAADMQEPIELVEGIFDKLDNKNADIVFGIRKKRNDGFFKVLFSNLFWKFYRRFIIKDIPQGGVDIFGCNREVMESILQFEESNTSLIAQLFWMGYRREFIEYDREERQQGKSAWSFGRRLRYMMDSIFSFSDFPILFILWIGVIGSIISFILGIVVIIARVFNFINVPGYAATIVIITFSTSIMLMVQGIIGAYLWRTFENSKKRPLRIISKIMEYKIKE